MQYSDDPVADFERYDAEQEEEREKLPICYECKEEIDDDYVWDIEGTLYCDKCIEKLYKKPIEDYIEED